MLNFIFMWAGLFVSWLMFVEVNSNLQTQGNFSNNSLKSNITNVGLRNDNSNLQKFRIAEGGRVQGSREIDKSQLHDMKELNNSDTFNFQGIGNIPTMTDKKSNKTSASKETVQKNLHGSGKIVTADNKQPYNVANATEFVIATRTHNNSIPNSLPTKPMHTVHDDGFVLENDEEKTPKLPNIETYIEKKTKSANYVMPIVAVIFSVPIVAILISVIYKRGTDWWQHRNYRRMDFLIEGMYNN